MKPITNITFTVKKVGRPVNCKPVTYTINTDNIKLAKRAAILMLQQENTLSKYYNIDAPACNRAELHEV